MRGIILTIMFICVILLTIYFTIKSNLKKCEEKVIYKYIPRTIQEEEESPVYVSEIFKTMFSQPSTWVDSINEDTIRRQEGLNNYFISLV